MVRILVASLTLVTFPALALAEAPAAAPAVAPAAAPAATPAAAPAAASPAPAVAAASAAPASGTVGTVAGTTEKSDEADKLPFHALVSLSESVGVGTFVANEYARTPNVSTSLLLMPSYTFKLSGKALSVSAREYLSWEHTKPDNATGRGFSPGDLFLSLGAPALYTEKFSGIQLSPSVRYVAPISYESRFASSRGSVGATVGLSRSLYGFDLGVSSGISKGFFKYTSKVATAEESLVTDPEGRRVMICRGNEAFCGTAGMNTSFSVSNNLSVRYNITGKLNAGLSYMLINAFKYAATDSLDQYTSQKTDSNGNRIADVGMGRVDQVWGITDVSYNITDKISAGLAIYNIGPAKTHDNKSLRFPFFDFVSTADNLSSYSLSVNALF